ncbi:RrF2 family transcriptional regulator [Flagellimonas amoyensis]|uniref:RrF2 family transcriptional regulator n=1 Tax=Flagellimonas amoyensis TaxID=2169401 RepID=UPI000D38D242|nr:Rrf2 family transcriptional regulator [Allomuricauda amoyensis]
MLSKKSKYAIKALVHIASKLEEQPVSVRSIATEENIPLKFLESILAELKNARILRSTKGKYGGYSLNKSPDEIHMAEVMRLFDGAIALLPCVSENFYERCEECVDELTCGIRQVAMEIRKHTVAQLHTATLTNILQREERLRENK